MYYRAEVYKDSSIPKRSFKAGSIKVLKSKAEPFIEDDKVTEITVSRVEDIGFFKVPKMAEDLLEDEML